MYKPLLYTVMAGINRLGRHPIYMTQVYFAVYYYFLGCALSVLWVEEVGNSHILLILFLLLFQVLTWLDNHGNVFLDKNTNVGRSLQKATSLQKAHDHFETIAEVRSYNQVSQLSFLQKVSFLENM